MSSLSHVLQPGELLHRMLSLKVAVPYPVAISRSRRGRSCKPVLAHHTAAQVHGVHPYQHRENVVGICVRGTALSRKYLQDKVIGQVWSSDGQFMLIEAAELLPKWVDSSQHGSLDSISRNRVWMHRGALHLIPLHSSNESMDFSCKGLTFSLAARVVFLSLIHI